MTHTTPDPERPPGRLFRSTGTGQPEDLDAPAAAEDPAVRPTLAVRQDAQRFRTRTRHTDSGEIELESVVDISCSMAEPGDANGGLWTEVAAGTMTAPLGTPEPTTVLGMDPASGHITVAEVTPDPAGGPPTIRIVIPLLTGERPTGEEHRIRITCAGHLLEVQARLEAVRAALFAAELDTTAHAVQYVLELLESIAQATPEVMAAHPAELAEVIAAGALTAPAAELAVKAAKGQTWSYPHGGHQ